MKNDAQEISEVQKGIVELFGLQFTDRQLDSLVRGVRSAARELNHDDSSAALASWISNSQMSAAEIKALSKHLTVGETYFFREKVALDFVTNRILPELIKVRTRGDQHIRIWSAGCSSGEEPYTIAILLNEMIPDIRSWNITIYATDINSEALHKAAAAIYSPWSFRETSPEMKEKYFIAEGVNYRLKREITEMVTFSCLNLARDTFPSAQNNTQNFDIIFCRNVLMYFAPPVIHRVAGQFYQCLNEEGWLITSQVELNNEYFSAFSRIVCGGGVFYSRQPVVPVLQKSQVADLNPSATVGSVRPRSSVVPRESGQFRPKSKPVTMSERPEVDPRTIYDAGKYRECADECQRRIEAGPFDVPLALLLIKSLANLGELDSARVWAERVIDKDGVNNQSLFLYASILVEQNDTIMAEKVLTKVLYLNPGHIAARLNLGRIYRQSGKNRQAIKQYENLLQTVQDLKDDAILPDLEGMNAGRLKEMLKTFVTS